MVTRFLSLAFIILTTWSSAFAADIAPIAVNLPEKPSHPFIACTPVELARLKAAWAKPGPERNVLAGMVKVASKAIEAPLEFPPRGGQHNQWYQCDACEVALKTIDDTHHECPKCKKVYSGPPYDDVVFARTHNANLVRMRSAAWAYAITGEKHYAEFAAKVLLGYAERYKNYPYHSNNLAPTKPVPSGGHLFEQTLNEAAATTRDILPAYDLIHDSGVLTENDHPVIRENLLRPLLENIGKYKAKKSNWQSWHNAAMLSVGAMLGEAAWVDRAINDPDNGFLFQMHACVLPEGMWYENSWSYHFYTLRAIVSTAEVSRRIGIDLWSRPELKKMFTLAARYTLPDGTVPRYGDSVTQYPFEQAPLMAAAAGAYQDPVITGMVVGRPTLESIMRGIALSPTPRATVKESDLLAGSGNAILRTQGDAGLVAAITFAPFGGFHGHFDKLSFILYGHGRELGVDPGRAASQAYRLPNHKNWYRATVSHNAVMVDGKSQEGVGGVLNFFSATPTHAIVSASADDAYPGITNRRVLLLTPTYLLLLDNLRSANERRFDWLYHHRGQSVQCDMARDPGSIDKEIQGAEYIKQIRAGGSDGILSIEFLDERGGTRLLMNAHPGTGITLGDGPGESLAERIPMAMLTRRGTRAQFAAVIEPLAKGQTYKVSEVSVSEVQGAPEVVVKRGLVTDRLSLSTSGQASFSTDGKILLKTE